MPATSNNPVIFEDQPVLRAVSDSAANELSADYVVGSVFVNPAPSLSISRSDQNAILSWPAWAAGFNLETSATVAGAGGWTNIVGSVQTNGSDLTITPPVSGETKYFRLRHP